MDRLEIKELPSFVGKEIISYYLATGKELREGNKDFFLRLRLTDKTGSIVGNLWNNAREEAEQFEEGDCIKVKATVINYKGQIQLTLTKIRKAELGEFDLSLLLPTTKKDMNQLAEELFSFVDSIQDSFIQQLLRSFFDDKELFAIFSTSPAAKGWHHNFIGGLLEHSLSVAKICDFASTLYPIVQRDLLLCGALLHDIGKIYEYNQKPNIEFTNLGRLIGHLSLGDQMVCEHAKQINQFPPDLLMKIRHLILSHHGEYEKASVRLPQSIEAVLLHQADNLDAQTTGVKQLMEGCPEDSEWTEFDRLNERYYFLR